ncbi:response regulator [Candidatus Gracilibacteria bacterium]|nr:response regulator [Candidatus Gracilibacteria bacterium]
MTVAARILIADDDPALSLLLHETLREAGYDVLVARNGDELVRIAQEQTPDLLLIDLVMPLMDGFEAIRQLRNDTRTAHLPMIILTARSASAEVVTGFDSGADDYIVKPYDIDVLLARIRSHLRRAAQLPVRNPLTGLPGNMLLQAELEHLLAQSQKFALLYIDLDNFKAFNDAYGFARGDRAIHLLANVLTTTVGEGNFIGHIGGDDFAVIHHNEEIERICRAIIDTFDAQIGSLYDDVDRKRGFLLGVDRQGVVRRFGMLSLSIAVVSTFIRSFASVDDISKVAAELKSVAKLTAGSCYEIDRRHKTQRAQAQERRGRETPAALLAVDEARLRERLTVVLRAHGYRVLLAADQIATQTQLARTPNPRLVVTDSSLGTPVSMLAQQLPPTTPLILFVTNEADAALARDAGATAALVVPDDLGTLDAHLLELPSLDKEVVLAQDTHSPLLMSSTAMPDSLPLLDIVSFMAQLRPLCEQAERNRTRLFLIELATSDTTTLHYVEQDARNDALRVLNQIIGDERRLGVLVARVSDERWMLALAQASPANAEHIARQVCATVAGFDWSIVASGLHVTLTSAVRECAPNDTPALLSYVNSFA